MDYIGDYSEYSTDELIDKAQVMYDEWSQNMYDASPDKKSNAITTIENAILSIKDRLERGDVDNEQLCWYRHSLERLHTSLEEIYS